MQQILSEALDLGYVGGIFSLSLCETLPAWFMHLYHCCRLHWNHICRYSAVFLLHSSSTEHAMCSYSIRMDKKKEGLAGDLLIVEGICADLLVSFSFSASFTGVFWGGQGGLNVSEKHRWGFVQILYGCNILEVLWCSHHSPSYPALLDNFPRPHFLC